MTKQILLLITLIISACNNNPDVQSSTLTAEENNSDTFDNSANTKLINSFIDKNILKCDASYYNVIFSTINVPDIDKENDFRHTKFHRNKQCDGGVKSSFISVLYNVDTLGSIKDYVTFYYDGENDFEYKAKLTPDDKIYYCFTNYADIDGSSQICYFDALANQFLISDTIYQNEAFIESSLNLDEKRFEVTKNNTRVTKQLTPVN